MSDAIAFAYAGLSAARLSLDKAARSIAEGGGSSAGEAPSASASPITGAAASAPHAPADALDALVDMMAAEAAYKANLVTLKTAHEMLQSLYRAID